MWGANFRKSFPEKIYSICRTASIQEKSSYFMYLFLLRGKNHVSGIKTVFLFYFFSFAHKALTEKSTPSFSFYFKCVFFFLIIIINFCRFGGCLPEDVEYLIITILSVIYWLMPLTVALYCLHYRRVCVRAQACAGVGTTLQCNVMLTQTECIHSCCLRLKRDAVCIRKSRGCVCGR